MVPAHAISHYDQQAIGEIFHPIGILLLFATANPLCNTGFHLP